MDRNIHLGLEERIRMAMDGLDDISMQAIREKKTDLLYDVNNAYGYLRQAYLKVKTERNIR